MKWPFCHVEKLSGSWKPKSLSEHTGVFGVWERP